MKLKELIIEADKNKIYVQKGQQAPEGKKLQTGPRGGQFFIGSAEEKEKYEKSSSTKNKSTDDVSDLTNSYLKSVYDYDETLNKLEKLQSETQNILKKQLSNKEIDQLQEFNTKWQYADKEEAINIYNKLDNKIKSVMQKLSRDAFGDKPRKLYRGLSSNKYEKGKMNSWTTDRYVAKEFADDEGGKVFSKEFSKNDIIFAPFLFASGEGTGGIGTEKEFVINY